MAGLTDVKARAIKPGETVADGTVDGLRLIAGSEAGKGRWNLRYVSPVTGKRRDMGLFAASRSGSAIAHAQSLFA